MLRTIIRGITRALFDEHEHRWVTGVSLVQLDGVDCARVGQHGRQPDKYGPFEGQTIAVWDYPDEDDPIEHIFCWWCGKKVSDVLRAMQ